MGGLSQISATNTWALTNQDCVWGFALIINGAMFLYLVYHVTAAVYREEFINLYGSGDWYLAVTWEWVIRYLAPLEVAVVLVWWAVDLVSSQVKRGRPWYQFGTETVMGTLVQWLGLMLLLIAGNIVGVYLLRRWRDRRGRTERARLIAQTRT
ncbi:hypothetical protein EGW08_008781 [Elysia chlorotica]|uniref:Uncharacterized protein n=1 Tax=Elysia chlorotica TaxID=188477 RepID=A0A3S1BH22_ELYCH|nr:hypothetical protein EGW08_008781 [Elysia chlorotica]